MREDAYRALIASLNRSGVENAIQKQAEAREALARLLPYQPQVRRFYKQNIASVTLNADEIIALLGRGPGIG